MQAAGPTGDMAAVARSAGLRYVSDSRPGIRRVRAGKGFRYLGPDGVTVRESRQLRRIRALGIPPAWTDVWISPAPNGHIQASGRDAKGRKQYRYHDRWREVRDATKYGRMVVFGEALPQIRERVRQDLASRGLPRAKVLATVAALLDMTHIRIGNEEYAKENHTYGLTTLREEHVAVSGSSIRFQFRGKAGKEHRVDVRDRRLARIIRQCQEISGQELFHYRDDDGALQPVTSDDVNEYLREISGQDFTAKDFRTWAGTLLAACALRQAGRAESETQAKKQVVQAIKATAEHLGNTPAICRKCYVHPGVIDAYLDGSLLVEQDVPRDQAPDAALAALRDEELAVLRFLKRLTPWDDSSGHTRRGAGRGKGAARARHAVA